MAYTNVFGGTTIQPSQVSYRSVTISANYQFSWPQTNEDTDTVIAATTDVNATVASLSVAMPDATLVANGFPTVFTNEHTNTYTVTDIGGNTITTVSSGQVKYVLLKDNSTANGTWYSFAFGAGTSTANAASLAGAGLIALGITLNEAYNIQAKNANYTAIIGDRASLLQWTGGSGTFLFTASATLGSNWFVLIKNSGSGTLTLDPNASELIDGNATLQLAPNESLIAITDGVNFYTVGRGRSLITTFTRLVKSVAGGTDVTLTSTEAANNIIELTGTLTANINVIIPTTVSSTDFYNNTNGAFTIDIKTSAGTGIILPQGTRQILLCDGTNVVKAVDSGTGTLTSLGTNSGLTGGPVTTTGTIGIATNGVTDALFRQAQALSIVGNVTNATANTADILYASDGDVIKRSGTTLVSGKIATTNLASGFDLPPTSGGTGLITYTLGNILYASASNVLSALAIGTTGQLLTVSSGIPAWVTYVPPFSKTPFKSSNQNIVNSTTLTLAHGLGAIPTLVFVSIICVTNDTGTGNVVGDIVPLGFIGYAVSGVGNFGISGKYDATNVYLNTAQGGIQIISNSTGSPSAYASTIITNANWKYIATALLY